jgi:hypothetical protein
VTGAAADAALAGAAAASVAPAGVLAVVAAVDPPASLFVLALLFVGSAAFTAESVALSSFWLTLSFAFCFSLSKILCECAVGTAAASIVRASAHASQGLILMVKLLERSGARYLYLGGCKAAYYSACPLSAKKSQPFRRIPGFVAVQRDRQLC